MSLSFKQPALKSPFLFTMEEDVHSPSMDSRSPSERSPTPDSLMSYYDPVRDRFVYVDHLIRRSVSESPASMAIASGISPNCSNATNSTSSPRSNFGDTRSASISSALSPPSRGQYMGQLDMPNYSGVARAQVHRGSSYLPYCRTQPSSGIPRIKSSQTNQTRRGAPPPQSSSDRFLALSSPAPLQYLTTDGPAVIISPLQYTPALNPSYRPKYSATSKPINSPDPIPRNGTHSQQLKDSCAVVPNGSVIFDGNSTLSRRAKSASPPSTMPQLRNYSIDDRYNPRRFEARVQELTISPAELTELQARYEMNIYGRGLSKISNNLSVYHALRNRSIQRNSKGFIRSCAVVPRLEGREQIVAFYETDLTSGIKVRVIYDPRQPNFDIQGQLNSIGPVIFLTTFGYRFDGIGRMLLYKNLRFVDELNGTRRPVDSESGSLLMGLTTIEQIYTNRPHSLSKNAYKKKYRTEGEEQ
ncbi:hypothetical protein H4R33_003452 [Dimargaris cristalligena]|uniref:Uncharacterized protein n=1 Tax=Dimargaris cristalligena TaxID=215637 RepID=A0A4P9ZZM1_9FUNG|nr:hypothetical protein H4R33_003452 [Dimargaris cristalligena]RKP38888.1 hypothetical protein BJ085DRAFT_33265 [Dimargaris cristalligena]|eukprot:RKP38888.1 hypothetical protein BJ085DRAFT_33265 [Dimargaris cristalligena]